MNKANTYTHTRCFVFSEQNYRREGTTSFGKKMKKKKEKLILLLKILIDIQFSLINTHESLYFWVCSNRIELQYDLSKWNEKMRANSHRFDIWAWNVVSECVSKLTKFLNGIWAFTILYYIFIVLNIYIIVCFQLNFTLNFALKYLAIK